MKKKLLLYLTFLISLISCSFCLPDWKNLDLHAFKISIPKGWKYVKHEGEDSFIGEFKTSSGSLLFDYSNNGYANHLIQTEQEYLKAGEWKDGGFFYKPGVTYTADFNVKNERIAQMKKLGTTDSSRVNVEADPSYQTKIEIHTPSAAYIVKHPNIDYIAKLTYKDSTIYVPIKLPAEIKAHHIRIDTIENYIIKTVWPKKPSQGMTGVYMKNRSSSQNFQLSGIGLSKTDQDLALEVFKTIRLIKP